MQSYDKKANAKIKKSDVSIAKNYLDENEIKLLGLLVEQYLAFTETMAQQQTPMYMKDWTERLDTIVQLNGKELLTHVEQLATKNHWKNHQTNLRNIKYLKGRLKRKPI
jgi:hypothetical protein